MRISRGRLRFLRPVASSRPRGEFCSSPAITLSVTWFASIICQTRCGSSRGSTRLSCSVHRRSRIMAAATIEQRMIGHISGPPARTISHILDDPTGPARPVMPYGPSYRNRRTSPLRIHLLQSFGAAGAPEKNHSGPPYPARALAGAAVRRTYRQSEAVDAAAPGGHLRLRGRARHLLRAAADPPAAGGAGRTHLADQPAGDVRHHLAGRQSLYAGAALLLRLPRGRGDPARAAASFPLRRRLEVVPLRARPRVAAVRGGMPGVRGVRRRRRLGNARARLALAGVEP